MSAAKSMLRIIVVVIAMFAAVQAHADLLFHQDFDNPDDPLMPLVGSIANDAFTVISGAGTSGSGLPRRHDLNDGNQGRLATSNVLQFNPLSSSAVAGTTFSYDVHAFTSGTANRVTTLSAMQGDTMLMSVGVDMQQQLYINGSTAGDITIEPNDAFRGLDWAEFTITLNETDWDLTVQRYLPQSGHYNDPQDVTVVTDASGEPTGISDSYTFPYLDSGLFVSSFRLDGDPNGVTDPLVFYDNLKWDGTPVAFADPMVEIDTATGAIAITNFSGDPLNVLGYSIRSDSGALDDSQWTTIAGHYDASPSGDGSVDMDDSWTVLTAAGALTDLSEAELAGGDGGVIAHMQTVELGTPWIANPFGAGDLAAQLLLDDGTLQNIAISLTGPDIPLGDIAGATVNDGPDGNVDIIDWLDFRANQNVDLAGSSLAQAYQRGDFDGDLDNDLADFLAFVAAFDAANGPGAFQAMVPEPGSMTLLVFAAAVMCLMGRRHGSRQVVSLLVVFTACVVLSGEKTHADVFAAYDAGLAGGGPADLDPELQGWIGTDIQTSGTIGVDANAGGLQPDGATGFNAWQINDILTDGAFDGPRYNISLTAGNFNQMFSDGWVYEFRVRPVSGSDDGDTNAGFSGWGINPGLVADPGWGLTTRERVGFTVQHIDADDSMQVVPIHGGSINLGANSAASFHTLRMVGASMSSAYEFFIDDVSQGNFDISDGSSNSAFDNLIGFQSGSSGDTGRVANWNQVLLQTADVPELSLQVNTLTGATSIINDGTPSVGDVSFNAYSIHSAGMALDPVGWNSLQDQDIEDSGDPGDGLGWEEFDASDIGYLGEGFLTGFTTMANMSLQSLGNAFNPDTFGSGMDGDLVFQYTDNLGVIRNGQVNYITDGLSCDLDGDMDCDTADLRLVYDAIAAGTADNSDIGQWLEDAGAANGKEYKAGDTDLDGNVGGPDFTTLAFNFGNTGLDSVDDNDNAYWDQGNFDGNESGLFEVGGPDFTALAFNFGHMSANAVPEPAALPLLILGILAAWGVARKGRLAPTLTVLLATGLLVSVMPTSSRADVFVDRHYQFGDDSFEGGSVGAVVGSNVPAPFNDGRTLDSAGMSGVGEFQDLFLDEDANHPDNAPTYVDTSTSGRPGAATNPLGIRFDGDADGLDGRELNSPNDTWFDLWANNNAFPRNWTGIFSRGIQLWVRPEGSIDPGNEPGIGGLLRQDIVIDTGEHGIYISGNDNWGLQFDNVSIESEVAAVAGQWTHVMERTLSGALGGALLVDGVAVAARGTFYDPEGGPLSVGANQALDGNFFKGELDELTMFVWGDNSDITPDPGQPAGADWGELDLSSDNEWIATELDRLAMVAGVASIPVSDVNLDGAVFGDGSGLPEVDDVSAFVDGWLMERTVSDVQVGDWVSRQNGDLNYDGITDLGDAFMLHEGLLQAGQPGLDFSLLPEPATAPLTMLGLCLLIMARRRD